jgi:3',5'-cyclic AMP phosphodiesterase CpdA
MPIHLPAMNRRQFLTTAAGGAAALGGGWLSLASEGSADADPHGFALLSDTHIFQKRDAVHRRTNMYENMRQVSQQVLQLAKPPAAVLINGDCAFLDGQPDDYAVLLELLAPYAQAGLPVHLTLGNHDDRTNFWQADGRFKANDAAIDNKHVSIITTARANWFLLDSLEQTNSTPGLLGLAQLAWLSAALDAHRDRPAIIAAHHHPAEGESAISGLKDTKALFEVLAPRKHVKAYIFGHTHHWQVRQREGIHLINLPPVAYPFNSQDPSGWVHVQLGDGGATVELRALDPAHPKQAQRFELNWRAG